MGALTPAPTTPLVTLPIDFVAPVVAIPTVLRARSPPPVVAFLAVPGYFFAPSGVELAVLDPLFTSLFDAGREFDRLMIGLRAVEGRALGEGWYVWPVMEVP